MTIPALLDDGFQGLTSEEVGMLVLMTHRLWRLMKEYRSQTGLDEEEWSRLTEDLEDLVSEELSSAQRLMTARRLPQTYGFLLPQPAQGDVLGLDALGVS